MLHHFNEVQIDNKRICYCYWYSHVLISRKPVWHTVNRTMLKFKDKSLKYSKADFNAIIKLPEDTWHEISWWEKNIFKVFKPIRYPKINITVYTNASFGG